MESQSENPTIIFAKAIDQKLAEQKLDRYPNNARAPNKGTKDVWLLRESSVDGLLTASFFNKEKNGYQHIRMGFVDDDWQVFPANKEKAIKFAEKATLAFKDNLPENSADKLYHLLSDHGFKPENQVLPNPIEATKTTQYTEYTDYKEDSPGTKYGQF